MLDLGHYFFYIYESRCIYKCGVCICTEKYLCGISFVLFHLWPHKNPCPLPSCSHHFDQQTFTYPGEILLRKKKIAVQSILSFVNTPNPPIILKLLIKIQIYRVSTTFTSIRGFRLLFVKEEYIRCYIFWIYFRFILKSFNDMSWLMCLCSCN